MKPLKFFILTFLIVLTHVSCKKDSPDHLNTKKWAMRNVECGEKSLEDLISKLQSKISQADKLRLKLISSLSSMNCGSPEHVECIPQLGIQAISGYMVGHAVGRDFSKLPKAKSIDNSDGDSPENALNDLLKNKNSHIKDIHPDIPKKAKKDVLKAGKLNLKELGLTPDSLKKQSLCGTKVTSKCSFSSLSDIISQLVVYVNQSRHIEKEASLILNFSVEDYYASRVSHLDKSIRNLVNVLQQLNNLEKSSIKFPKKYLKKYKKMSPLKIKMILVDVIGVIPLAVKGILKGYLPKVNSYKSRFVKHKKGHLNKFEASGNTFTISQNRDANRCLKKKGCWKFRLCIKRFKLPGIDIFNLQKK